MRARLRRLAALAAAAAAAASTTAIPAASGAEAGAPTGDLRARQAELDRHSTSALLELYALETRLADARDAAARARARLGEVEAELERVAARLEHARRDAELAESLRAERLRGLYETGDVHPLAVVLGAESLGEALTGLDDLRLVAEHDGRIVALTQAAQQQLRAAREALRARRVQAEAAAAAAAARSDAAERAHGELAAYVQRLAHELRMTSAAIAAIERQARAARQRAEELAAPAQAGRISDSPAPAAPAPPAESSTPLEETVPAQQLELGRTLTVVATGYALTGTTATGIPAGRGVVAVDPTVIPLGTRMTIPGYGEGVAADVGSAVKGNKIDLWFPTRAQALQWGRRTVTVTFH